MRMSGIYQGQDQDQYMSYSCMRKGQENEHEREEGLWCRFPQITLYHRFSRHADPLTTRPQILSAHTVLAGPVAVLYVLAPCPVCAPPVRHPPSVFADVPGRSWLLSGPVALH